MGLELTTSVVIGTYYTGSCKSNYHTITTTTAPVRNVSEKFEGNKWIIRSRESKERQHNDKARKGQNTTQKTEDYY